tara:strand:+ start:784 stop:1224 length:441 start_codon:yes stop_codon:yes gene_type:complete
MFGIPLEVISMLLSTILGGYMKMKADAREDEHHRAMLTLKLLKVEESSRRSARKLQTASAKWARKFIVVCLMAMAMFILAAPMIFNEPTNVLYEVTHGFKLWLFDFTWKSQEWKTLAGIVTPDWLPFAIMNVLGFYFGTAAVTRRN